MSDIHITLPDEKTLAKVISVKGEPGDPSTITVGTTTTGEPGTDAAVENVGTETDAILNFTIPRGADGEGAEAYWGQITGDIANQTDLNTALNAKESTANKVNSISSSSTNNQYPSAQAAYNLLPTSSTITLLAANWALNSTTNLYEYTVVDANITTNHRVDGNMDLENQEKIKDGYTETFNGSYKIYTSEAPSENITMDVIISLTRGASV